MNIETQAVHAGQHIDPATGAITPPIHLSTTFERQADGSYPHGYDYTRSDNPNRAALEESLTVLEGGFEALAFSSGSTATMTLLQALKPGDHVLAPDDLYFGVRLLITDVFGPWGLQADFVDMTDPAAVQNALQPNTRLLLIETPSNPLLKITDIGRIAEIAHNAGALLAVDNTIPTAILQRPLELEADMVIYATTKFIAGHSDVLGGTLIAKEDSRLWEQIKHIRHIGGAVPSPFDCWLTMRGMQTMPYRVRAQSDTALHVCQFLNRHPAVERVNYPGLITHPGHQIAAGQMKQFGGLFSFQVKGGAPEAMAVAARVNIFTRATSFGGTHSLIEHRASIEGPASKTPQNLLRVSIGLENRNDLIEDLAQALG
jgi:cystathionine gamma-synthase